MGMAKAVAELISSTLRHSNGLPVECVIADSCIGGVAEAAMAAEKFRKEGVGVSLTVTPCWCYGSETMDMEPLASPRPSGASTAPNGPGAVYLAAVSAAHTQKGLPAFTIYGRDVQDIGDSRIPADVRGKILRFVKAGLAVATMRGKSYLSVGGVSMGIAGSIVNQDFFEDYLGMRVECVDMTELMRRIEEKIYDQDEFKRAHAVGARRTAPKARITTGTPHSRKRKDWEWEFVVKCAMIVRDLMVGNPRLAEARLRRGSARAQRHPGRVPGPAAMDRPLPEWRFPGSHAQLVLRLERHPRAVLVATENDSLNGVCMLLGHLLTDTAQIFADVRTYWSPDAVQRVTGQDLTGRGRGRDAAPDQLRRGGAGRLRQANAQWPGGDETVLGNHAGGSAGLPEAPPPGRRPSTSISAAAVSPAPTARGPDMPATMFRLEPGQRARARPCRSPKASSWICRRYLQCPGGTHRTRPGRRTGLCRTLAARACSGMSTP